MKRLRIYQDKRFREHPAGEGHVESAERLKIVEAAIDNSAILHDAEFSDAVFVDPKLLRKVHTAEYLESIEQQCNDNSTILTAEIIVAPKSWQAALLGAGACADAVNSVLSNEIDYAFIAPRPPGHHAESNQALGFCLINNVAVTAMAALESGVKRVAILDWDLHHGNGTQEIFWNEPRVLFMSMHQRNLYPAFSGNERETGGPEAPGKTLNLPLEPGTGNEVLSDIFRQNLTPELEKFKPELILISAGFDGHREDPLGRLLFTEDGFEFMTKEILQWSKKFGCGIVSVLEGGYGLKSLADSTVVHLETIVRSDS